MLTVTGHRAVNDGRLGCEIHIELNLIDINTETKDADFRINLETLK